MPKLEPFEDTHRAARDIAFTVQVARDLTGYQKWSPMVVRYFTMDGVEIPDVNKGDFGFRHHHWIDGAHGEVLNAKRLTGLIQMAPLVNGGDRSKNVIMVIDYTTHRDPPWAFAVGSIRKNEEVPSGS